VQELLKGSQDYFASLFKHSIDSIGENCPVPVGTRWFDFQKTFNPVPSTI